MIRAWTSKTKCYGARSGCGEQGSGFEPEGAGTAIGLPLPDRHTVHEGWLVGQIHLNKAGCS